MAQDKVVFHVKSRDTDTKPKKFRNDGSIPANIYGLSKDSEAVVFDANMFRKLYDDVGDTGLVYVKVDDKKEQPVLIDAVDTESVGNKVLHVAFKRVNLKVAVTADVPIELIGENEIPETIVTQVKQDVEVEALPANLPEKFEVDISTLTEVGQTITLADLDIDSSKVSFVLGEEGDPAEETVVVLQQVQEEPEEVEEPETEDAETPEGEEAPAEEAEAESEESSDEK